MHLVVGTPERAVVVNEAFCAMTGYSAEETLALRPFVAIFTPEARSAMFELPPRPPAGDEGAPTGHETELLSRDGRRVPVAVSFRQVGSDQPAEVVATFRDLTDNRRAESELAVRARQQEVVAELGRQALVHRYSTSLMDAALQAVARTLGVDFVEVLELLPDRAALLLRAGIGWADGLIGRVTVMTGRGSPAGLALESDGPVGAPG